MFTRGEKNYWRVSKWNISILLWWSLGETNEIQKEEEREINNIKNKNGLIDYEKLMRKIGFKERDINSELVKKHFFTYDLGNVLKTFKKSKNNSERNKIQVSMIKNRLRDLKEKITDMSEEEKKSKNQMK